MGNEWVTQIEPNIVAYVGLGLDDVYVTSDIYTADDAVFPSAYIRELSQVERGMDIDGDTIISVLSTFQIDIYAMSQEECKDISTKTMLSMKELRFEVLSSPLYTKENNYYRSVARYRRLIAGGDSDIVTE